MGLLMLLYLLFNSYYFQNYLTKKACDYVNETYKTRISIGEISYDGWTFFSLRRVLFGDQKQDTTFYAGRLQFNLAGISNDSGRFTLRDVTLDEGLCKVTTYKDGTYSLDVTTLFDNPNDTIRDTTALPFWLELKNLEVMSTRFQMFDSTEAFTEEGFDPFRMDVREVNFRSKKFNIIDDSLSFDVKNFTCIDRCGFEIKRMKAQAIIAPKIIELNELEIVTPYSTFRNYFSMRSKGWETYSDFITDIKINARLRQSEVDMRDIAFFAPQIKEYQYKARVSADLKGTIDRLSAKNVLAMMGNETKFTGDLVLNGLPNIDETFMEIGVDYASTNKDELEQIIAMSLPDKMSDLGKMVYKGKYTGFYKDFVSYGTFETAFGIAETDLNMKLSDSNTMASAYSGKLVLVDFELGNLLDIATMGKISLSATMQGEGFDLEHIHTQLDAQVQSISLMDYAYKDAQLTGRIDKKKVKLDLQLNDSNIQLFTKLQLNLDETFSHIKGMGSASQVNLKPLGFTESPVKFSSDFNIDFHIKDLDNHFGEMSLDEVQYEKGGYTFRVHQIKLESENEEGELIKINSDFLKAIIRGQINLSALPTQLSSWSKSFMSEFLKPEKDSGTEQDFEFSLNLLSTASISPLFFPGYNVTNLELEGNVHSKTKTFEIIGYAGNINLQDYVLNQLTFSVGEEALSKGELLFGFNSFGKPDSLLIGDFGFKAEAIPNQWNLQYYIRDSLSAVMGEFMQQVNFVKESAQLNFLTSWLGSNQKKWYFNQGQHLNIFEDKIQAQNLVLSKQNQSLTLDGYYAFDGVNKNMSCRLQEFKLSTVNDFIKDLGVEFGGEANGYVVYKNFGKRDVIISDLALNQLALDKDTLGDYNLGIAYKEEGEDLLIDLKALNGKIANLKAVGTYDIPGNYLKVQCNFEQSKIVAFQAFVKDYVKLHQGEASLNALLEGPLNDLKLNGALELNKVAFRVDYLMTNYRFEQATLVLENNLMRLLPFNISDEKGSSAKAFGNIQHKNFSDFNYQIKVEQFKNLQVLNTTIKDNDLFYGTAFATGNFELKGTDTDVSMFIKATADKGTKIIVNPFGASTETGETYLHFVSYDTTQEFTGRSKSQQFGVGVYMDVTANPNAEIQVIFDAQSDDKIRAKGNGRIKMDYLPDGNFLMNGSYTLTEGEYRFSALNVLAKKFDLQTGSNIVWQGDPLKGRLDITGMYRLKATVNTIINMNAAPDPNVRVPVDCLIKIKGVVEKPDITFDMNFPDLQNNITGSAASELNAVLNSFRKEPEMMNQQMLFLLLSGSFVPLNNTNNANASSLGTQTISDLISKQAAGLLGKAIPNLDVSMDVLNASDPSRGRIYVLSATKRFLDNRLELQTSQALDNTQSNYSLTYQFKKTSQSRIKVFNTKGFDAIYNRNVVTSGFGLYYRREFDTFSELFKPKTRFIY
jgi:hypothetical protein